MLIMSHKNNDNSKTARYTSIDGINYAVPPYIKYVCECKRGFLYGKARKPEIVIHGKNKEWTPEKETLHARNQAFKMLWPLRIDVDGRPDDWEKRVFTTTIDIQNASLPLIDCNDLN